VVAQQREGEQGSRLQSSAAPTILKALLREQHLQNYGMFKRMYEKTARTLDKSLVGTYPSEPTFRRWLAGRIKHLPHAEHCAVLEAMLPGWTAVDLFQPCTPRPESTSVNTTDADRPGGSPTNTTGDVESIAGGLATADKISSLAPASRRSRCIHHPRRLKSEYLTMPWSQFSWTPPMNLLTS
jgi:hypothetical protein